MYKYITLTILIIICASSAMGQTLIGKTVRLNDGSDTAYSTLSETDIKQKVNVTNYASGETSDTLVWTGSGTNFVLRGGVGTGIDADKLDGQHGSYYRAVTNLDFDNILLPDSTGSVGAIYFNTARAMHNYGDAYNFFAGTNAGNFTMLDGATSATAFGVNALCELTTGTRNTAVGAGALAANTIGKFNNAFGQRALRMNISGLENTALSESALAHNTTGSNNVAVGGGALFMNNGDGNTAIGCSALLGREYDNNVWNHPNDVISTGDHNTALGAGAGQKNSAGSNNLYLGAAAFWQNDGDGNIGIGRLAGAYETTSSNTLYINNQDRGNLAGDKAKSLVWGTFAAQPADQRFRINAQTTVNGDLIVTGTLTAAEFVGAEMPKGGVVTVAKSGGDYTTIQAAVNAATIGTTVLVFPGEYAEEVSISKAIALIGTDKTNCVIKKSVAGNGSAGDHLVTVEYGIKGAYVEIRGLTMWNTYGTYSSTALKINSPARVSDCVLIGNDRDTLILGYGTASDAIYIDNCYISGIDDTISILGTSYAYNFYISNCRIIANQSTTNTHPVWLGDNNLIADFSNCDFVAYAGYNGGIEIENDSGKTIRLNIVNCRSIKSDYTPMPLFYNAYGTGTTAYIANCQYSAIGNANITANFLASSAQNIIGDITFSGSLNGNVVADSVSGGAVSASTGGATPALYATHNTGGDYCWTRFIYPGWQFSNNGSNWNVNLYQPDDTNVLKTDNAFQAVGDVSTSGSIRATGAASIGAAKFTVDANGNITKVNNVTTSFPASNSSGFMKNNGSGTLSWAALADADIPNDITVDAATNATNATNASNATTATASLSVKLDSTPDNLTVSGKTASGTVGENVTFGQMLYLKSDGKYWKADASSTATMTIVAMAAQAISGDGTGSILLEGYARNDSWDALTIGAAIWGSETAGAFSQIRPITADSVIQNVGYAAGAKTIYFNPNSTFIVVEAD